MKSWIAFIYLCCLIATAKSKCLRNDSVAAVCPSQGYLTVPDDFQKNISVLNLSENNISKLTRNELQNYNKVTELNLNYNAIQTVNDISAVSELKLLIIIHISSNHMLTFSFYKFRRNTHIEEIYADNNPRMQINIIRTNLRKLHTISLKYNEMDSVPLEAFKGFINLRFLYLQHNKLQSLPEGMSKHLKNLERLYLAGNPIKFLDSTLHMKSDISQENFMITTAAPEASSSITEQQCFMDDPDLVICIAQGFIEVPRFFPVTTKYLNLSQNNISSLNGDILKLYPNVTELNLSYNKIRSTANIKDISFMKKLRVLYLSGNGLLKFDLNIFSGNIYLEELYVDHNPYVSIVNSPVNLRSIKQLSFNGNNLSEFPLGAIQLLARLEVLDVRNNLLASIPKNATLNFPNLQLLLLGGNPIATLDSSLISKTDLIGRNLGDPFLKSTTTAVAVKNDDTLNTPRPNMTQVNSLNISKSNSSFLQRPNVNGNVSVKVQNHTVVTDSNKTLGIAPIFVIAFIVMSPILVFCVYLAYKNTGHRYAIILASKVEAKSPV